MLSILLQIPASKLTSLKTDQNQIGFLISLPLPQNINLSPIPSRVTSTRSQNPTVKCYSASSNYQRPEIRSVSLKTLSELEFLRKFKPVHASRVRYFEITDNYIFMEHCPLSRDRYLKPDLHPPYPGVDEPAVRRPCLHSWPGVGS
jgi:hypothetical protein